MDNQQLVMDDAIAILVMQASFWILIAYSILLQFVRATLTHESLRDEWPRRVILGLAWGFGCIMFYSLLPVGGRPSVTITMAFFTFGGIWADESILRIRKLLLNQVNGKLNGKKEKETDDTNNRS